LVLLRHVRGARSRRGWQLRLLLPGALLSLLLQLLLQTLLDSLLALLLKLLLSALLSTLLGLQLGLLLGTLLRFVGQALALQRRISVLAQRERYRGDEKNRDRDPTRIFVFHQVPQAMDATLALAERPRY
jgi:hypothetical protein